MPPARRRFARLSCLGVLLPLLLAGQGCGQREFEKAFAKGVEAMQARDYDLAITEFSEVIQLKPKYSLAYYNRGYAYAHSGDWDKALADYDQALQINPGFAEAHYGRGLAYRHKGLWDKAVADDNEVIRIKPDFAQAYINLASLLAVCPDASIRNGAKAVEYATKGCELTGWNAPATFSTLAAAYAEVGDFDNAVKWQTKYLESNPSTNDVEIGRARLALYQHKKPLHEVKP